MPADDKAVVGSTANPADALPESELKRLGKYQIEKKIGAGGMGAVFLARDTELKRVVALKVLPRDKAMNPILVRRFRAEAQACAQLRHNNIVAVYDSGEADGYLYIAMEYVEGQDLFEMVSRRGVVPVKRSIEIIKQIAAALQHAYEQNIVHRDIKPSNLLIRRDGVVKLTDLGLARSVDDTLETNITRAGTTVGTVDYMSPEQARNSKLADTRSDLYSLGCTWYQMLTGSPPFPEGSVTNKLQAHAIKPIPDPRDKNPAVPEGLTAVIRRMMAKKPEDRYQTPAELLDELSHATLTQAAISREIFSDLSDYDQNAVVQFEDESDGYLQDDAAETPPEVPVTRRKKPDSTRAQVNGDTNESTRTKRTKSRVEESDEAEDDFDEAGTSTVAPKTTSRPSSVKPVKKGEPDDDDEEEDEPDANPIAYKKSTKPTTAKSVKRVELDIDNDVEEEDDGPEASPIKFIKSTKPSVKSTRRAEPESDEEENDDPEANSVSRKSARLKKSAKRIEPTSDTDDNDSETDEESDDALRKSRGRSKSESSKGPDSKSTKPKADSNDKTSQSQGIPKVTESQGLRKPGVQKPLPPKRQPAPEDESEKQSAPKEWLKYLAAAASVIIVVCGLGYVINRYSGAVAPNANPFGETQATQSGPAYINPNVQMPPVTQSPDVPAENLTTTITTGANTKPDSSAVPFDIERVPDWVRKEAEPTGLPQLTVGPAQKTATHFNSLDDALLATPNSGAIIRLIGDGPFPLTRVELTARSRVHITGASPQARPVVTLKSAEDQAAGLKLSDGRLDLRGIHFVLERRLNPGSFKAIEVVDGQLDVRECSFSSLGTSPNSAIAMAVGSTQDSSSILRLEPMVLIDRVVVRGDGLTAFGIQRANVDALVRNSLFATGTASSIEVSGHVAPQADLNAAKPRRILRFYNSTICSQSRAFDLAVDESGKPPQTAIIVRDSLCCSLGVGSNSAVVFAGRWPQFRSTTESWLNRLTWRSSNSLYIGFEQLIDLNSTFKVTDAATWQRVWNSKTDSNQFQKFAFPEASIDDLGIVAPQVFDPKTLSYREVKASDGGLPGCDVSRIVLPEAGAQDKVKAISLRPILPSIAIKSRDPVEVRRVDLRKEDLGAVLNREDWASGTLFEAAGGGLCFMSPARIEGKSLRIVFKQTEGANFKLQPLQPKASDIAKTEVPASMISITRGTLELTNASLEGFPISKGLNPDWAIQATDSTVVLNGCRLNGSESEAVKQLGLIRWVTSVPASAAEAPALVCNDCYLAGTGSGIRMEVGNGNLHIRNSVIAVRGDAIDIRPQRVGNALLSAIDVENATLSATGSIIRFQAASGDDAVTSPVRFFFDRCVFAPPLPFKGAESSGPTLLRCVGSVLSQHQVTWWGTSNGVARQIVHFIYTDDDSPTPNDEKTGLTAWHKVWNKAGSTRLLTGDKGVNLIGELPNRMKDLKPGSFELHKSSQAAVWADGGRPIGANTHGVETAIIAKKPGADGLAKPLFPTPANKNNNNPGF